MLYQAFDTNSPVMSVFDVVQEEQWRASHGTSLETLMERAGTALATVVTDRFNAGESKVIVFVGTSNNGGDGWVAARKLGEAGFKVDVFSPCQPENLSTPLAVNAAQLLVASIDEGKSGQVSIHVGNEADLNGLTDKDVILDCMLGTGFSSNKVREPFATWIEAANAAPAYRIACDVPSGLFADSGAWFDKVFHADLTLTMIACKNGMKPELPGAVHIGELYWAPLKKDADE